MTLKKLWRPLAVSLIAAGPAGGFLFGLLNAGDPDPNPVGRFFYACIMAALTTLHAGFPPQHAAGSGPTVNVWPHIVVSYFLILGVLVYRVWKNAKEQKGT